MKITKNQFGDVCVCKDCTAYWLNPYDPEIEWATLPLREFLVDAYLAEDLNDCQLYALVPHGGKKGYIIATDTLLSEQGIYSWLHGIENGEYLPHIHCCLDF